jgi:hypothetical protein
MLTFLSLNARQSDLGEKQRLRQQKLRARLRQLRWRVCHEIRVERENALIYRRLARRFAPDSPHRLLLRMIARSGMRRMRRLKDLLHELPGAGKSRTPRRWSFRLKCWYVCNAPRRWAILRLKHQND